MDFIWLLKAALLGVLFDKKIEAYLFNPITVSIALIGYGVVILVMETLWKNRKDWKVDNAAKMGFGVAFAIGIFQCLAMVPGTSRSAATILGAMFLGLARPVAAEFSFFLAIPTILGASGYKLLKTGLHFSGQENLLVVVGFLVSFAVAVLVIKFFIGFIKNHDFRPFGWYRIGLGALVLVFLVGMRIGG